MILKGLLFNYKVQVILRLLPYKKYMKLHKNILIRVAQDLFQLERKRIHQKKKRKNKYSAAQKKQTINILTSLLNIQIILRNFKINQ